MKLNEGEEWVFPSTQIFEKLYEWEGVCLPFYSDMQEIEWKKKSVVARYDIREIVWRKRSVFALLLRYSRNFIEDIYPGGHTSHVFALSSHISWREEFFLIDFERRRFVSKRALYMYGQFGKREEVCRLFSVIPERFGRGKLFRELEEMFKIKIFANVLFQRCECPVLC